MKERKPFEGLLGNTKELRAMQKLMSMSDFDFNISELSKVVGVSRNSAMVITYKFLEWGILIKKMRRGNMDFFTLDKKSPLVIAMESLNDSLNAKMFPEIEEVLERVDNPDGPKNETSVARCPSKSSSR
jgi:hypothetical protein